MSMAPVTSVENSRTPIPINRRFIYYRKSVLHMRKLMFQGDAVQVCGTIRSILYVASEQYIWLYSRFRHPQNPLKGTSWQAFKIFKVALKIGNTFRGNLTSARADIPGRESLVARISTVDTTSNPTAVV